MRRITFWLTSTAAILVLLFSYRTSTMGAGGSSVPAIASGVGNTDTNGTVTDTPGSSPTSTAPPAAASTGSTSGTGSGATKKSTAAPTTKASGSATSPDATSPDATSPDATSPDATSPDPTSPAATSAKVVTGSTVDTRWGPVQVAITVKGNKITAVAVPVYPNGNNRDAEINNYALPVLVQETLSAQSAQIDAVSGASVTSNGYISSLQSAIDAANL